jgi:hypothetical protein
VATSDSRTATDSSVFDQLVGEQQDRFRDGEPERLARGFKPDIGNPIALAPAQAGLFTLALEGCRRASKQRRFYILKCVHADDGVEAAVDSAGDHRHHATPGAHVKLGSLGAERVFDARAILDDHRERSGRAPGPNTAMLAQNEQVQARAGISDGSGRQSSAKKILPQWQRPEINMALPRS